MKEVINLPTIGDITLVTSRRAKNLRITIKPVVGVVVTKPFLMSKRRAIKFVASKETWILKNLKKTQLIEEKHTFFDENTVFHTNSHQLHIVKWEKETFRTTIKDGVILFKYPETYSINNPEVQKRIRKAIEKTWKLEAEETLVPLLHKLAIKHQFNYSSVTIKNVTSKWGSCSYKNDIILSLHLMRVPKHLQEYVILHELCHTKEKNHQKPFWNLMNLVTNGMAKAWDKELKQYSTKIY